MTKIDDVVIKTKDKPFREWLSDFVALWNRGKMGFSLITGDPTDTPTDPEIRIYDSGSDVVRIYVYAPSSQAWFYVTVPNKIT